MNTNSIPLPEKFIALLKAIATNLCDEEVSDKQLFRAYDWILERVERGSLTGSKSLDGWKAKKPSVQLGVLEDTIEGEWTDYFDNATNNDTTYAKVLYAKDNIVFDVFNEVERNKHFHKYSVDANYTGNGVLDVEYIERILFKTFISNHLSDIYVVLCHCPGNKDDESVVEEEAPVYPKIDYMWEATLKSMPTNA
jgi:hypothetical protein